MTLAEKQRDLDSLLAVVSLSRYSETESLSILQRLIDHSFDLDVARGAEKAIQLTARLQPQKSFPTQVSVYHYFISLAWSDLRAKKHATPEAWHWEQDELENEIINLRLAQIHFNSETQGGQTRLCQILTNLANVMDWTGRFVVAFDCWNRVLSYNGQFGMALGAKGNSMIYHAMNTLYDEGHKRIFLVNGYKHLKKAVDLPLESKAKEGYLKRIGALESCYPGLLDSTFDLSYSKAYNSEEEKQYREWCLDNCLFLNPLNDMGQYAIASHDPFGLPTMVINTKEDGGTYHSFFNQIKQEYVSSRFLLFESRISKGRHFSDNEVMKYEMFDGTINSLSIEKMKTAFRIAYSIFDKVAFFLNSYLNLAIPSHKVNFRSLWFLKQEFGGGLRSEFNGRMNLAFRALYWLSKDLHYDSESFKKAIDWDATELAKIRNHIEHKSFKVFDNKFTLPFEIFEDKIAYSILEKDFFSRTLKLIKLSREAIIYLSLGIRWEERLKSSEEKIVPSIQIQTKL